MKKYLFSLLCLLSFVVGLGQVTNMTGNGAVVTNSGTGACSLQVQGNYQQVTVQAVVTKLSGTVAGTVICYGSVDGTNYQAIGADTLTNANQATNQKFFVFTGNKYMYYKLICTGSGTMSANISGYVYTTPGAASKHAVNNMLSVYSATSDTVDNAGSGYVGITISKYYSSISIHAVVTKISGTAAGTVTLQGSNDGTNYTTVVSSFASATTLSVTDVTTSHKIFTITGSPYKHYRLSYTGSGTMSCRLQGYFMPNI